MLTHEWTRRGLVAANVLIWGSIAFSVAKWWLR